MRIYSLGHPYPFDELYPEAEVIRDYKFSGEFKPPGILVLWGGEDIHPSFYNRPNVCSYVGFSPSMRDQIEAKLFARAVEAGLTVVGVCRGAQLGCALSGGILVQNITGHVSSHRMTTIKIGRASCRE